LEGIVMARLKDRHGSFSGRDDEDENSGVFSFFIFSMFLLLFVMYVMKIWMNDNLINIARISLQSCNFS